MKCLCGYEREKENFIKVISDNKKDLNDDVFLKLCFPNGDNRYSRIFACPECGTLKTEVKLP